MRIKVIIFIVLLSATPVIAQDYSLDISIDKQIYSSGENVTFKVILLENTTPLSSSLSVTFSDVSEQKKITKEIIPNIEQKFYIEKDYASGYWKIETSYMNKTVRRFFSIGEREEAEFIIEGDKLIIKNIGNVPYTKTIQILIGDKVISQKQYIEIGDSKEIRLIAPEGDYNIQVSDGKNSISKTNIHLTGTGKVIGALDDNLANNQPLLGSSRNPDEDGILSLRNFSVAWLFIGAVFGLAVLLFIERVIRRKRGSQAKGMIKHH